MKEKTAFAAIKRYFTAIGSSSVKTIADYAAYHNKHW